MFIPNTRRGILLKMMRVNEENLAEMTGQSLLSRLGHVEGLWKNAGVATQTRLKQTARLGV